MEGEDGGGGVAWVVEAVIPLCASSLRMSPSESGRGSDDVPAAGSTLTPAAAGAGAGAESTLAAAPATGCTTCGWPWGSAAAEVAVVAAEVAVAAPGVAVVARGSEV